MLELLILYSLNKQELTLYGLQKYIAEYFGEVSNPSHGALHPALKRLILQEVVSLRSKISDGGKRYTYYSLLKNWKSVFDEKFMTFNSSKTETLEAYLLELKVKLLILDIVDKNLINEFREKNILKLVQFENQIKQKFESPYIEISDLQKSVLKNFLTEIEAYKSLLNGVN